MGLRQASRFALEMHVDRTWRPEGRRAPLSLFGRRVGLHGLGAVARALLPLLAPFGVILEAYSEPVPTEVYAGLGVKRAESLASLYRDNDIVIVVEALTPHTEGSATADILAGMLPGSVLVNVGRGAVIDETALNQLAQRGDVQIGLDIYATEPLPAISPLRGLRHVSLLPHTAGPTVDWYPACTRRALLNFESYLRGQPLPDLVSLQRYDVST